MRIDERIACTEAFAEPMAGHREEIVLLLMGQIGKTLPDTRAEFDRTLACISDTVAALKQLDRDSARFALEQGVFGQIRRAPLGVILCMEPFNDPLNETFTPLIPALIMGNTLVFKSP